MKFYYVLFFLGAIFNQVQSMIGRLSPAILAKTIQRRAFHDKDFAQEFRKQQILYYKYDRAETAFQATLGTAFFGGAGLGTVGGFYFGLYEGLNGKTPIIEAPLGAIMFGCLGAIAGAGGGIAVGLPASFLAAALAFLKKVPK